MSIAFLELVNFLVTPFPIFHSHPIASDKTAAYYMKFHLNIPPIAKALYKKLNALYIF